MPRLRSRAGCHACKSGHRKCDEGKPVCSRCERLGLRCQWRASSSATRAPHVQTFALALRGQHDRSVQPLPSFLVADAEAVYVSSLLGQLFRGANMPCDGPGSNALTVQSELHFAKDDHGLSKLCIVAMAQVYWGSMQGDEAIVARGLRAKGTCLQRLQKALNHKASTFSGDLVAAVALLRLFETMSPDSIVEWVLHAQGLTRLFISMGPRAFQSPEMRRLVENNRWVMITSASALRIPTPLDKPEWKSIPWEDSPKDVLQTLLDIYCQVPGLHALWDAHSHSELNSESIAIDSRLEIGLRLRTILTELQEWRHNVDAEMNGSVSRWQPPLNTDPQCPWQSAVSFTEVRHAYTIGLFNMMVILLCRYVIRLPETGTFLVGPACPTGRGLLSRDLLPLRDPLSRATQAAEEIAMIIPWTLQDQVKGAGTMYMGAPALICYRFWQQCDPDKAQWFDDILHLISSSWSSLLLVDREVLR